MRTEKPGMLPTLFHTILEVLATTIREEKPKNENSLEKKESRIRIRNWHSIFLYGGGEWEKRNESGYQSPNIIQGNKLGS